MRIASGLRMLVLTGVGICSAAAGLLAYGLTASEREPHFDKRAFLQERRLPNIALTDHEGRTRRFYDDLVKGKRVAINFMYASCSNVCELSSQVMAGLQSHVSETGEPIELYSISLDPERDTPQNLAEYRSLFTKAENGWTFLTARSVADITELRRKLGVYEPDPNEDRDITNHSGLIILGNEPSGRWTTVPSQVHPTRVRQAVQRMLDAPDAWTRGEDLIKAVPRPR